MKKRILALLMALVLTVSCLPPVALAEGTQATETSLPSVEQTQPELPEKTEAETAPVLSAAHGAHTCEHCADSSVVWTAWESGTDLPNTTGHYYLTQNVNLTTLPNGKALTGAATNVVLCLNGQTVTTTSRAYRVSDGAKLTITDCTGNGVMKGGKSIGGVIGVFSDGATGCQVSLHNVTLEGVAGNEPAYGGAISVYHTNMTLSLKDVTLRNFTVTGGASDTEKGGAAVYFNAAGTSSLTMDGCTVSGCTDKSSANTGAVRIVKATTATFTDCTFTGNSNTGTGASAIMLSGTTATMSGCTVTGNSSTKDNWVGAVYVNPSAPLTLSGKNVIKDNTANGATNLNLVLNEVSVAQFLSFTNASAASELYITAERGHADPNGLIKLTAGDPVAFTYENDGKLYTYDKASSTFVLGHAHNADYADISSAVWQKWNSKTSLPTSGHYYLTENVDLTGMVALNTADGELAICLNGHTITSPDRIFRVSNGFKLTICDCTGTGILKAGASNGGAVGIFKDSTDTSTRAASLNMYNVTVEGTEGKTAKQGGAISSTYPGATVKLTGVTFRNLTVNGTGAAATATAGGSAIYMYSTASDAKLYMDGCTVTGCSDLGTDYTGALRLYKVGTVEIKNSTFSGNTSAGNGGSAMVLSGVVNATMSGCTVTGNKNTSSSDWAGAIYLYDSSKLTLSGKNTISGNTTKNGAAAIDLMLQEATKDQDKQFLLFKDVDPASVLNITAKRGTTDPNKMMDASGDTFNITFGGDTYSYDVAQDKFVKDHKHTDGYAGVAGSVTWLPWTETDSLPTSGYYYLTENVQIANVRFAEIKNDDLHLCLNGKTITARAAGTDGKTNIYRLTGSGSLTICDCGAHVDNGAYTAGKLTGASMGAIFTMGTATGTVNIYDGIFTNNESNDSGAVAVIQNTCQLNIYGGEFTGNTATNNGGAIYIGANATATIKGGTFSGNTAGKDGGVIINAGTLNLQGGKFTGNTAGTNGGAIHSGGVTNVSGNPEIIGNTANGKASNLYLTTGKSIALGEMATGTDMIGISVAANTLPRDISNDMGSTDCSAYFFSDNGDYEIINQGNKLHLKKRFSHPHTDGYAGVAGTAQWQPWTSKTSLPTTAGYWVLTEDVTLTTRFAEIKNDNVFLCLNGHSVTARAAGTDGKTNIYRLTGSGSLTICDCGAHVDNGTYTAGKLTGASMGAIFTMGTATGTVNIYDGIFTNNTSNDSGAVAVIQNTCQLNIHGGEFTNNTATNNGGAIYIGAKATATIKGGTFSGNTAGKDGGVIINTGTLNLEGGKFTGNTAGVNGGAIHHSGSVLSISGSPEITGNTANGKTSNLYLATGKTITLGEIGTGTAKIGVSMATNTLPRTFSGDMGSTDCTAYFFSDNADYEIVNQGNKLHMKAIFIHPHSDNYAGVPASTEWQPWTSTTSLPTTAGYWVLMNDVTLNTRFAEIKNDDVFLCLNGKTITARAEGTDGKTNIYRLTGSGSLTICDCGAHVDNGAYTAGKLTGASMGAIFTMGTATGTVNIYDGIFTNNTSNDSGAVAVIQNTCQLNIYGGEFTGNTATNNGGAIYIGGKATVTVKGGSFSGNTAGKDGGAIINTGTLNLEGGKFTGNTAGTNGGAIHTRSITNISGNPEITGNTVNGTESNLYLTIGNTITLGDLAEDTAKIGISVSFSSIPRFLSEDMGSKDCSAYFFSDDPYRTIIVKDNRLYIAHGGDHKHCDCAGIGGENCSHDNQAWAAWTNSTTLPTSGYWYLTSNVTVASSDGVTVTGDLHLCLNGFTVDGNSHVILKIRSDEHDVVITDCQTGGNITNGSAVNYGAIYLEKGSFTMFGGKLTNNRNTQTTEGGWSGGAIHARGQLTLVGVTLEGNTSTTEGGAICLRQGAKAHLENCVFQNNSAKNGGAIYTNSKNELTLINCIFTGNTSKVNGGAIYARDSLVTVESGSFTSNNAPSHGGAIYLAGCTLQIQGGTIKANTAGVQGGGIFATECVLDGTAQVSKINISGGEIIENKAPDGAGIATIRATEITMTQGSINKNEAANAAGGVLLQTGSKMTLSGEESYILYNKAGTEAGGIFVSTNSQLTMDGGRVSANEAGTLGGGIVVLGGKLTINNGHVFENSAVSGGGIYAKSGSRTADGKSVADVGAVVTLNGGNISTNTATTDGGGVAIRGENTVFTVKKGSVQKNSAPSGAGILAIVQSKVNIEGGSVNNNTSKYSGGGIFMSYSTELNVSGGKITENTAGSHGGGIYLLGVNMNLTGGEIIKNSSAVQGGGIFATYKEVDKNTTYYTNIEMSGGKINHNNAPDGGGIATIRNTTINMTGGTIWGNEANNGAGVLLQTGSKMTISGEGLVAKNEAVKGGGGIYVSSNSSLTLDKGGKITENIAGSQGGGVMLLGTTFTMNDGTIYGNQATSGGGVYAKHSGDVGAKFICKGGNFSTNTATSDGGGVAIYGPNTEFILDGGYIQKNSAPSGGGVLAVVESKVTIKNGSIVNNTAKSSGGGVFMSYTTEISISGGYISKNEAGANGGGVNLLGSKLTITGGKISENQAKTQGGGIFATYKEFENGPTYKSEINIRGGNINGNKTADGAGIATTRYTKVNMTGGTVSNNKASKSAGGILVQKYSVLNLSGGTVSGNQAKYGGGGVFASSESTFNMNGGTVSGNYAEGDGAGVHLLYSTGNFNAGTIQNNKATKSNAGGILVRGSKATMNGTNVLDNYAQKNGGGIVTVRYPNEKEGIDAQPELIINNGRIAGNRSGGPAGGMLLQSQAETKMTGGVIENNYAKNYGGGVYVSMNHTFTVTGGKITGNQSDGWGGGIYHLRGSVGHYENCEISYNKAASLGGGLIVLGTEAQPSAVTMKKVQVIGNEAREGAGVRTQDRFQSFQAEGCSFKENKATSFAGGLMIFFGLEGVRVKDCLFENNTSGAQGAGVYVMSALKDCEITGCTFKGNVAGTEGGGMWTQGGFLLKDCVFDDNHATLEGGAIATDVFANTRVRHPVLYVEGCVISNNTSGTNGGGIYADTASYINISDTEVTNNTSKAEGGGIWLVDDSTLSNVTVTGNRSGGEGYALYYHASEYDGRSYIRGAHKMGGEMIVKDNEGGDMYMGEQTGIAISAEGLTGNTYMNIRLHSGFLTQLLRGAYNYEGGDTIYIVTAGTRSLTEPEVSAQAQDTGSTDGEDRITITPTVWIGGGALAVAVIAIVLILLILGKKKKAAAGK